MWHQNSQSFTFKLYVYIFFNIVIYSFINFTSSLKWTLYIQYKVHDIQCEVYEIQYEVYDIQCEVYDIQCEVYDIQCEVYDIQCEVYAI